MKTMFKIKLTAQVMFIIFAMLTCAAFPAFAGPPDNRPPDNRPPGQGSEIDVEQNQGQAQGQHQGQLQGQAQQSSADAAAAAAARSQSRSSAEGGAGGAGGSASATTGSIESHGGDSYAEGGHATGGSGSASVQTGDTTTVNEGNTTEFNDSSENNNTNVVLVPNNNTSSCQRVYGISFGNGDGAGALGVPFRDKSCDFEQAADDAAARGDHKIAWWWRCHKKNLWKTFEGDSKEMRHLACWNSMVSMLEASTANFNEPQSEEYVLVAADGDFDPDLLMAELSDDELKALKEKIAEQDDEHQQVIERQEMQETVIQSQKAELERLRRQSARLQEEQKKQEQDDAARRAAALKALSKKSEEK